VSNLQGYDATSRRGLVWSNVLDHVNASSSAVIPFRASRLVGTSDQAKSGCLEVKGMERSCLVRRKADSSDGRSLGLCDTKGIDDLQIELSSEKAWSFLHTRSAGN
jgi:hypothetical protein